MTHALALTAFARDDIVLPASKAGALEYLPKDLVPRAKALAKGLVFLFSPIPGLFSLALLVLGGLVLLGTAQGTSRPTLVTKGCRRFGGESLDRKMDQARGFQGYP